MEKDPAPRIEMLTDGVFAIVATLLVLDIHVPSLGAGHTSEEFWHALGESVPTLVAFVFSFLTILIYWINHDSLSKAITRYPYRLIWLNLLLLLWITLIPFTTKFIAEYPDELVAVLVYGFVMFMTALTALVTYAYIAFRADLLAPAVDRAARMRLLRRWASGPVLYLVAIAAAFLDTRIALAVYAVVPLIFFVPGLQEAVLHDLREGE
jgi:uncharacterized membrane protein